MEVSMRGNEQQNSKTILQIFRTIEQRDERNSEVCFSRTLKFIGRLHSRMEAHSPVSSPRRTVGVQPGSLSSPRKQKERWTRASSRLTIAMWWFCGISGVSAPKAFGSTERCLGSTHFEKASSLAHRCFISIRPRWLVFWRRRDIEQDDNRARAGHVETSAVGRRIFSN